MRFVEVSPGSPDLDFYVNGTGAAYGLGFESFTSYLPVLPGSATIHVSRSGRAAALASLQQNLAAGRQYTVLVSHGLAEMNTFAVPDQDTVAEQGQTDLRVINAVEGPTAVSVHVSASGSAPTTETLTLRADTASSYLHLASGRSYQLAVSLPGNGLNPTLSTVALRGDSGAVRTLVVAGVADKGAHPRVVSFLLADVDPL